MAGKMKAAVDAAAAAKAAADKAVADAVVTPEQQKQLTDAEGAAKAASDKLAAIKGQLERMISAVGRSWQTADASGK